MLSSVSKSARYRGFESALSWLEDSHTVNFCRRCTDPNVVFRLTEDEGNFKCYMADTGLLVSHAFADGADVRQVYRALQFGEVSINRGMFVENVVAQQLRAPGGGNCFTTRGKSLPQALMEAPRSRVLARSIFSSPRVSLTRRANFASVPSRSNRESVTRQFLWTISRNGGRSGWGMRLSCIPGSLR